MSIWGLGPIAVPAATDRMPLESALNTGGYSTRGDFMYRDATGRFVAQGGGVNGAGLIDVTYGAPGASITALRATLNSGAGGAYIGGYSAEAHFAHNCEFISGSGWVARHTDAARYTQSGGVHTWYGNSGLTAGTAFTPTECMRINPNGFVGVGSGWNLNAAMPVHISYADQGFARFRIQNTGAGGRAFDLVAGIPGAAQGDFSLHDATNEQIIMVWGGNYVRPGVDNYASCGAAGQRWSVAYAVTGTINTCDGREKTWRELLGIGVALFAPNLYGAELRAGLRAIEELGFFQWNDAIALKGPEEARWHFGPRAQRVWAIFADEGLCDALIEDEATGDLLPPEGSIPPAFLCFDKIAAETAFVMEDVEIPAVLDDEGNEIEPARTEQQPTGETYVTRPAGNRFGVRIDQLHSLMIAALNAERLAQAMTGEEQAILIAGLTARLELLEAAA